MDPYYVRHPWPVSLAAFCFLLAAVCEPEPVGAFIGACALRLLIAAVGAVVLVAVLALVSFAAKVTGGTR